MDLSLLELEWTCFLLKCRNMYHTFFFSSESNIHNTLFYVETKLKKRTGHVFVDLILKCPHSHLELIYF